MATTAAEFIEQLTARNPLQPEFHQAVGELLQSVWPLAHRRWFCWYTANGQPKSGGLKIRLS